MATIFGTMPRKAIDMYPWVRGVLRTLGDDQEAFEQIHKGVSTFFGSESANPVTGEILLMAFAKRADGDEGLWKEAIACGIPNVMKKWSATRPHQEAFNKKMKESSIRTAIVKKKLPIRRRRKRRRKTGGEKRKSRR